MKVVENAIIVPIFTMIIIALISVGIYMHDRIIIRNMVSQISIEYEKESDITARKELIKRGERYAADRTMFLRDINIYDDRVYEQDESIVCSAIFPVIGSYAGMSDICNISENVNKIDNARLIRKTNALMEVVAIFLIIGVIILIIVTIVRYASRFRKSLDNDKDEVEYINNDEEKEYKVKKSVKVKDTKDKANIRYRKLYKKYAKSKKVVTKSKLAGAKVDSHMMPEEITSKLITDDEAKARRITDDYEKARPPLTLLSWWLWVLPLPTAPGDATPPCSVSPAY